MAYTHRRERADGPVFRVMFRIDGKQRSESFRGPGGEAAAAVFGAQVDRLGAKAAVAILNAKLSVSADADLMTVSAWLEDYIAKRPGVTDGTRKTYRRYVINHIDTTSLGEMPVLAVTREHAEAWTAALAQTLKPVPTTAPEGTKPTPLSYKTVKNIHAFISHAFTVAAAKGLCPTNPFKSIALTKTRERQMTVLTPGEFAILLQHVKPHYQPLVATLFGTGMRFGEATALTAGDVDLEADTPVVRIHQAWKHTGLRQRALGAPKSDAGTRTVSLPDQLPAVLRPLIEGRRAGDWLFTLPSGGPIQHDNFHARVWSPAITASGLTKRPRIHDLRHSHASAQIAAGINLPTLMRRMGHEKITTTVEVYGKFAPDDLIVTALAASRSMVEALPELEG